MDFAATFSVYLLFKKESSLFLPTANVIISSFV